MKNFCLCLPQSLYLASNHLSNMLKDMHLLLVLTQGRQPQHGLQIHLPKKKKKQMGVGKREISIPAWAVLKDSFYVQ